MLMMAKIKTVSLNCLYQPSARTVSPNERLVGEYDISAIQP